MPTRRNQLLRTACGSRNQLYCGCSLHSYFIRSYVPASARTDKYAYLPVFTVTALLP